MCFNTGNFMCNVSVCVSLVPVIEYKGCIGFFYLIFFFWFLFIFKFGQEKKINFVCKYRVFLCVCLAPFIIIIRYSCCKCKIKKNNVYLKSTENSCNFFSIKFFFILPSSQLLVSSHAQFPVYLLGPVEEKFFLFFIQRKKTETPVHFFSVFCYGHG